jgi:hypothetical protein
MWQCILSMIYHLCIRNILPSTIINNILYHNWRWTVMHIEDGCLLGCNTALSGRYWRMFQRSLLPPSLWYIIIRLHDATFQKTVTLILIAMRTLNYLYCCSVHIQDTYLEHIWNYNTLHLLLQVTAQICTKSTVIYKKDLCTFTVEYKMSISFCFYVYFI